MSNSRLIAQDVLVQISSAGPFVPGTAPTFGSAIVVTSYATSIKVKNKVNTVDTRGFGDRRKTLCKPL